jgi:RNase P/RNase MRP subunit p30
MFYDIVFPKGNEEDFAKMALRIGCSGLIALYETPCSQHFACKGLAIKRGLLVNDINAAMKYRREYDFIFAKGERIFFESKVADYIVDLELQQKDFMHSRNSGMNQVLCGLAKENNKTVCLSFNNILNSHERDVLLGRMMQTVSFARKFKFPVKIASFARKPVEMRFHKDLLSFGISLGMHASEAETAVYSKN